MKGALKDRVLFGSDFPLITPDRWINDFRTLDVDTSTERLILKENAALLFELENG
jgi:hypothetical protein